MIFSKQKIWATIHNKDHEILFKWFCDSFSLLQSNREAKERPTFLILWRVLE